jgi:hypothetical protein
VESLIYAAYPPWANDSWAVTALSHYNTWRFTSHMTAAQRVLQYINTTAYFQLLFNGKAIRMDIRDSLSVNLDSDWAK